MIKIPKQILQYKGKEVRDTEEELGKDRVDVWGRNRLDCLCHGVKVMIVLSFSIRIYRD
jgi:hypothetical protein